MRPAPLLALFLLGTAAPQQRSPAAEPVPIIVGSSGPLNLKDALSGAASAVNSTLQSGLRFTVASGPAAVAKDGRNTAMFGPLGPEFHAYTYMWFEGDTLVEADIVFRQDNCWANQADGTPTGAGGCPIDLRTVALHELLHTAGFLHATLGVDKPSVMEVTFPAARHTLEEKDTASLATHYPPLVAITPESIPSPTIPAGGEGQVLAAGLHIVGWPAALTGLTVTSQNGPPLANLRVVHEHTGGSTQLGSSTAPTGPWAFTFADLAPLGADRLVVYAERGGAAPAALPLLVGSLLLLSGRRRRLLALAFVLAACGGGGLAPGPDTSWRFSVAPTGLTATGDAAIVGDAWLGPPVSAP